MPSYQVVSTITLPAAVSNGIAQSQSPAAAGFLTLNGSLVSAGVATLTSAGAERQVLITSGGDDSARTFTIIGTNADGSTITYSMAGANGAATSAVYFRSIASIYIDGAAASTVIVGTNGVGATRPFNLDTALNPSNTSLVTSIVSGAVNYTVQWTIDDLQTINVTWNDDAVLNAATAAGANAYAMPTSALRTKINSGTGSIKTTVLQTGLGS